MKRLKGELDLYIFRHDDDGGSKLVKHHHQFNYDTIRGRLDPNFSATCDRITRFECDKSFEYPRSVQYDELTELPLYLDEPLFVPDIIDAQLSGDGFFALSYDQGTTWWMYNGAALVSITKPATAAELRASGMDKANLAVVPLSAHTEKYVDHIIIMATPNAANEAIYGYRINMKYDSALIDPYYVRWIGDIPKLSRYTLETLPISSSKTDNTYTIDISNLSGVAPIEVDTIMTFVGDYIGTFTFVGLTVEINEVLVGTYTITVETDLDIDDQRSTNAKSLFWGSGTAPDTDGILGGVRHHGAETQGQIYTYNGGPVQNTWLWPFMPDKAFREASLKRSIGLPWSTVYEYGDNVIDPAYGLASTGSVVLWSTDTEHQTGLGLSPMLYRYRFLTTGDASTAEYLLFYKTRAETLMGLDRARPDTWSNETYMTDSHGGGYHPGHQHMLKDPAHPVIWNKLMYDYLSPDGEYTPKTASNPYHDLIIEVYDDHLNISKYGFDPMFTLEANTNEVFYSATASLEDPTGYDLTIHYYDSDQGSYYLASIPVSITRNSVTKSFDVTVNDDLTDRLFVGNISSPRPTGTSGLAMYDMLRVQHALGGPWTPANLLADLKTMDGSFLSALHEDSTEPTDDSSAVFDQEWDFRHLNKLGSVPVAADIYGDQAATFDGSSLVYLTDNNGDSGRSFRWNMHTPVLSSYLEFQPDVLQDSTLMQNRGGQVRLQSDGTLIFDGKKPIGASVSRTTMQFEQYKFDEPTDPIQSRSQSLLYVAPASGDVVSLCMHDTDGLIHTEVRSGEWSSNVAYDGVDIAGARWQGFFWDSVSSTTKVARVHSDDTGLFISAYDVDNRTYDTAAEYTVGGNPFTHAMNALVSMYTDDSGDPILVIYSGEGWLQTDGILEINLATDTLTQIAMSGTQIGYVDYRDYNDGRDKAVTFKDSNGDRITVAVKDPSTGQCFYYNHTTGICTEETLGEFLTNSQLVAIWGLANRQEIRPWSLTHIRGTAKALFIAGEYNMLESTHPHTYMSVVDLGKKEVITKGLEVTGRIETSPSPNYYYSNKSVPVAQLPHGHSDSNNTQPEAIHCIVQTPYTAYNPYCYLKEVQSVIDLRALYSAAEKDSATYSTTLHKMGVVEYGGFQIGVLDDQVMLVGPNKTISDYGRADSDPRLAHMNVGGELAFTGANTANISDYTSSNLYDGTVKNVVLRTQGPQYGAYRFSCYMYPALLIDSFWTEFAGNTTFLLSIVKSGEAGTYFLDSNSGYALTLITDANLGQVTPSDINVINSNLATVQGALGHGDLLGLVYYNIDGDTGSPSVSKTYVKYTCEANDPVEDLTKSRRTADPRCFCKNGHFLTVASPAQTMENHLGETVHVNYDDTKTLHGYFNLARLPNMVAGVCVYTDSGPSTPTGGCSFVALDGDDNLVTQALSYNVFSDREGSYRHYIMSDVFAGTLDISLWNRQHSDDTDGEVMVFYKSGEISAQCMYIPGSTFSYDNGETEQHTMFPWKVDGGVCSTALPYPGDAPNMFKETANAAGYKEWGDLRWYFQDGTGTSFGADEMISFSLANNFGYAIDNWQVINSFSSLNQGEIDPLTGYGVRESASADGSSVGIHDRAGDIDTSSTLMDEPTADDKFFVIFEDRQDR